MSIYRKASIEKLSSPEKLDKMVKLVSPKTLLSVIFILVIIISVITWGFLGTIPTKITGTGVIISDGGTHKILSNHEGRITEISVEPGDFVEVGDVIGWVENKGDLDFLNKLIASREILLADITMKVTSEIDIKEVEIRKLNELLDESESIITSYENDVDLAEENYNFWNEKYSSNKSLFENGILCESLLRETELSKNNSYVNLLSLEAEFKQTQANISDSKESIAQITIEIIDLNNMEINDIQLKNIEEEIEIYKAKIADVKIISHLQGKVTENHLNKYDLVHIGDPVISVLEISESYMEDSIVAFVPIAQGQRVKAGMTINVYPVVYNKQEYGHMKAIVVEVSDFAISKEELQVKLGNDALVQQFLVMGALTEIKANLIIDKETVSEYYWSSKNGRTVEIPENAICQLSITLSEKKPIELVIPYLSEKTK